MFEWEEGLAMPWLSCHLSCLALKLHWARPCLTDRLRHRLDSTYNKQLHRPTQLGRTVRDGGDQVTVGLATLSVDLAINKDGEAR